MQSLEGIVTSNKIKNTVTVTVSFVMKHPKYKKIIHRTTKLAAHTDKELKVGDKVRLVKTKPYSKTKHFRVL